MVLQGCCGVGMEWVREEQRTKPSLKRHHLQELAQIGLRLEKYFKKPQDVEFAVDRESRVLVLQSRQLSL